MKEQTMGHYRFRRSVKVLPGVRVNFNLKSTSITVGTKWFHKTISTTWRETTTIGAPGTGFSYIEVRKPTPEVKEATEKTLGVFTMMAKVIFGLVAGFVFIAFIIAMVQA
jgi:hypothetical protein